MLPAAQAFDDIWLKWSSSASVEERRPLLASPFHAPTSPTFGARVPSARHPLSLTTYITIRFALNVFVFIVTLLFNDFGVMVAIVGSVAGGALSYVLPPLLLWKLGDLQKSNDSHLFDDMIIVSWKSRAFAIVQMIGGAIVIFTGILVAFRG